MKTKTCECCGEKRPSFLFEHTSEFCRSCEKPDTNIAAPRTFVRHDDYTPDPTAYYRNNGNVHIKSHGDRC